jgi:hypothetical protein
VSGLTQPDVVAGGVDRIDLDCKPGLVVHPHGDMVDPTAHRGPDQQQHPEGRDRQGHYDHASHDRVGRGRQIIQPRVHAALPACSGLGGRVVPRGAAAVANPAVAAGVSCWCA